MKKHFAVRYNRSRAKRLDIKYSLKRSGERIPKCTKKPIKIQSFD